MNASAARRHRVGCSIGRACPAGPITFRGHPASSASSRAAETGERASLSPTSSMPEATLSSRLMVAARWRGWLESVRS